jgi:hypothetical protein
VPWARYGEVPQAYQEPVQAGARGVAAGGGGPDEAARGGGAGEGGWVPAGDGVPGKGEAGRSDRGVGERAEGSWAVREQASGWGYLGALVTVGVWTTKAFLDIQDHCGWPGIA